MSDNAALIARRERLLGRNMSLFYDDPVHLVRGEGVWLWDADGRRYLDCYNNVPHVGHCHPRVVEAITRQASTLNTHTRYLHEGILDYVERLTATFDSSLDAAILTCTGSEANDVALRLIYSLNGERCTSSSRLLVEDSIYDRFTALVAEMVRRIKVGHPLDPETVIGPLIHPVHEKKVLEYIAIGRSEGATLAAGGEKFDGPGGGCYVSPTLFTGADNKMRIAQEEIFGPVLTAIPFKDEADALALANDVQYGLTGYLWTSDVTRAFRFTDHLEAGMIWVNSENVRHLPTPFGGVKNSGIGRDGGDWSFDFYMETKNVAFATKPHAIQKLGG